MEICETHDEGFLMALAERWQEQLEDERLREGHLYTMEFPELAEATLDKVTEVAQQYPDIETKAILSEFMIAAFREVREWRDWQYERKKRNGIN